VSLTDLALRVTAQHPRDLDDSGVAVEHAGVGGRDTFARAFRHDDVVVRAGRDLREVRDGEDLMVRSDTAHGLSHLQADATTNTSVDFVEDERRNVIETRKNGLEREHDTRELAA
jgi:hypothetical protein